MKWLRNLENDPFGIKVVIHALAGFVLFMFLGNISWSKSAAQTLWPNEPELLALPLRLLELLIQIFSFCFIIRLYITRIFKRNISDFRISSKNIKSKWVIAGIMAPCALLLFYIIGFQGTYSKGNLSILSGITITLLHGGLKAGITEELLFRGFIMKLFENKWGKAIAVLLNSFLFAFVHLGNAPGISSVETVLMLTAYTAAGVTFSIITYIEKSISNVILMHALWNIVAESNVLRIIVSDNQYDPNAVINYAVLSSNKLIAGGFFGISASIPAIIAFLSPLLLLIHYRKMKLISK